eukprot:2842758-Prymnesium_polylepis.1
MLGLQRAAAEHAVRARRALLRRVDHDGREQLLGRSRRQLLVDRRRRRVALALEHEHRRLLRVAQDRSGAGAELRPRIAHRGLGLYVRGADRDGLLGAGLSAHVRDERLLARDRREVARLLLLLDEADAADSWDLYGDRRVVGRVVGAQALAQLDAQREQVLGRAQVGVEV